MTTFEQIFASQEISKESEPRRIQRPWLPVMFACLCCWFASAAFTQGATPPANRYLLLVETSRSMQPRTNAVFETVHDLLASGMKGQLQPGDSVGVWTYSEKVTTGQLPLQHARTGNHREIADRVTGYLRQQRFEKNPSLKELMPMVAQIVQNSPYITVIFICSGDNEMFGIPYDRAINRMYEEWRIKQAKIDKPFVTVLRAKQGKLTDFAVHPVPFEIQMPPLPSELVQAPPPVAKPALKPRKSLIVSGSKTQPATVAPLPRSSMTSGNTGADNKIELKSVVEPPPAGIDNDGTELQIAVLRQPKPPNSVAEKTNMVAEIPASQPPPRAEASAPAPVSLAAELQKVAALPELPPPPVPAKNRRFLSSDTLMMAGFSCAAVAALGLVYLSIFRRNHPLPRTSIITRSLHRQSLR